VAATGDSAARSSLDAGTPRYELAVPIAAAGRLVAVFTMRRTRGSFTLAEIEDATTLCAHAGIALEKARALAEVVSIKREWEVLFHSTAEGLALFASDGSVRRANDALLSLLGGDPPAHGHHDGWFPALSDGECPVCETSRTGVYVERTLVDGAGRTLEVATAPASEGGAVLVVRDVTSAYAAAGNLRQARQRMFESEKLAAIGRLAAGVSHEVNNPLMGIGGLAAVLLEEDRMDAETRQAVELIQREARRAAKITRDLLHVMHGGESPAERVDVNELASEVSRLRLLAQPDDAVHFALVLSHEPVFALASSAPVLQVLMNLLTNAEDAVAHSTRREVTLSTARVGDVVRIVVDDSGTGVAESIRDRLFEPFFTTKAPGKGTGLGLALCYTILTRLGGTIRLEDKRAPGARFVVELPVHTGTDVGVVEERGQLVG
jgi:signal transduction histidine kinase